MIWGSHSCLVILVRRKIPLFINSLIVNINLKLCLNDCYFNVLQIRPQVSFCWRQTGNLFYRSVIWFVREIPSMCWALPSFHCPIFMHFIERSILSLQLKHEWKEMCCWYRSLNLCLSIFQTQNFRYWLHCVSKDLVVL